METDKTQERRRIIHKMRLAGHTFEEIGQKLGITRQRACAILNTDKKGAAKWKLSNMADKSFSQWIRFTLSRQEGNA